MNRDDDCRKPVDPNYPSVALALLKPLAAQLGFAHVGAFLEAVTNKAIVLSAHRAPIAPELMDPVIRADGVGSEPVYAEPAPRRVYVDKHEKDCAERSLNIACG